jgi:hypothetical protein
VILTSGMAWSQAELDSVKAAVLALASGSRVVSVSYAGPPARSVSYGIADLGELRALLAEMQRSVTGATTFRRASFTKGFDPPRDL